MGQTRWQQLSTAWLSLSSCPAASGPADSAAAVVWSRTGQILTPLLAQVGFAACIAAADERGGDNLCIATAAAARNGTRQRGGGGLWGQSPLIQAMAALRRQSHSRQLQGKKEDEQLQVRQKPVLMSPLSGGLSHLSSTFIVDGQSIYSSKILTEQRSILLYDSHQGKWHLRARFY